MIDQAKFNKLTERYLDAGYGNGKIDHQTYCRDIKLLLDERDDSRKQVQELTSRMQVLEEAEGASKTGGTTNAD